MCLWREKLGGRVIIEQVTMGPCKHVKWGTYSYNIQTFQWENYTYQKADRLSFAITPIFVVFYCHRRGVASSTIPSLYNISERRCVVFNTLVCGAIHSMTGKRGGGAARHGAWKINTST